MGFPLLDSTVRGTVLTSQRQQFITSSQAARPYCIQVGQLAEVGIGQTARLWPCPMLRAGQLPPAQQLPPLAPLGAPPSSALRMSKM